MYDLKFTFVFFDRYNWNIKQKGAGLKLGDTVLVSDVTMGRFHQECLAKEYNIWGVLVKDIPQWEDQ